MKHGTALLSFIERPWTNTAVLLAVNPAQRPKVLLASLLRALHGRNRRIPHPHRKKPHHEINLDHYTLAEVHLVALHHQLVHHGTLHVSHDRVRTSTERNVCICTRRSAYVHCCGGVEPDFECDY